MLDNDKGASLYTYLTIRQTIKQRHFGQFKSLHCNDAIHRHVINNIVYELEKCYNSVAHQPRYIRQCHHFSNQVYGAPAYGVLTPTLPSCSLRTIFHYSSNCYNEFAEENNRVYRVITSVICTLGALLSFARHQELAILIRYRSAPSACIGRAACRHPLILGNFPFWKFIKTGRGLQ